MGLLVWVDAVLAFALGSRPSDVVPWTVVGDTDFAPTRDTTVVNFFFGHETFAHGAM